MEGFRRRLGWGSPDQRERLRSWGSRVLLAIERYAIQGQNPSCARSYASCAGDAANGVRLPGRAKCALLSAIDVLISARFIGGQVQALRRSGTAPCAVLTRAEVNQLNGRLRHTGSRSPLDTESNPEYQLPVGSPKQSVVTLGADHLPGPHKAAIQRGHFLPIQGRTQSGTA